MGRDADPVQVREDIFGNAVVEHALAVDDFVLLRVEGSRIILEELDQRAGLGTFVKDLCLALVDAAATIHQFCLYGCWRSWVAPSAFSSRVHIRKDQISQSRTYPFP